jgi:hypothetical protein
MKRIRNMTNSTQEIIRAIETSVKAIIAEAAEESVEATVCDDYVKNVSMYVDEARMSIEEDNFHTIALRAIKLYKERTLEDLELLKGSVKRLKSAYPYLLSQHTKIKG